MSASINAYSTAVAPLSSRMRLVAAFHHAATPVYARSNIRHPHPPARRRFRAVGRLRASPSRRSLDLSGASPPKDRAAGGPVALIRAQAPLTALPTVLNLLLAAFPRKATAAMITTAMSATISAYSTAVAPFSSSARTLRSFHQV